MIAPVNTEPPPRPGALDWVLGLVILVIAFVEVDTANELRYTVPAGVVMSMACVLRRVAPLSTVLLVTFVTLVTYRTVGIVEGTGRLRAIATIDIGALFVTYAAVRLAKPRTVVIAIALSVLAWPSNQWLIPLNGSDIRWILVDSIVVLGLAALALTLRQRASSDERMQRVGDVDERNELANDIHDSVAHHMSAIALRADAASDHADNPELQEALAAIKQAATTGLTDMRHLVTTIRADNPDTRPSPGLGDLRQLAAETTDAALGVDLHIDADAENLPVSVSSTVYAISREALTNIRRHATGATQATIRIRQIGQHLDLTISDNGAAPIPTSHRTGHGLTSITERAQSLAGELSVGPNPTGGWLVAARLPLEVEP